MNSANIEYKINNASHDEIFNHLLECSSLFVPALSSYVDIEQYAEKINNFAVKFEAWHNNKLIGFSAAYLNKLEEKICYWTTLSIIKEYQAIGIANKLILDLFNYASEKSFKEIVAQVNKKNIKSINMLEKHGFKTIKIDYERITMKAIIQNSRIQKD